MKKVVYMFLMGFLLFSPIMSYAEEIDKEEQEKVVEEKVTLEECVDINTAKFRTSSNSIIKVRFLALNIEDIDDGVSSVETPILKEAKEYTCTTLTKAKEIKLVTDDNFKEEDVYGRTLAWVFADDILIQDSIIKSGYGKVDNLYSNSKYFSSLEKSEKEAKNSQVGIWKKETTTENTQTELKNTKKKNSFQSFFDNLLASITSFIDDILENILKFIEDMI